MTHPTLDAQLDRLDERLRALSASLNGANAEQIQLCSQQFQRLTVELVQTLDAPGRSALASPQRLRRVRSLAIGLASVRENLLRQSAFVERALEVVMPASRQKATYSGSQPYGSATRQSGSFSVLSA